MRIELSEEDYRFLVDLAYLGEWMINAYRDPMRTLPEYEDALRQLLVFCEEAGFPELADEETHDPTSVLENDREVRRREFLARTAGASGVSRFGKKDGVSHGARPAPGGARPPA